MLRNKREGKDSRRDKLEVLPPQKLSQYWIHAPNLTKFDNIAYPNIGPILANVRGTSLA